MTVADSTRSPRKTLVVCGSAHALHDGFTDLLNVLYPLLQAQFAGLLLRPLGTWSSFFLLDFALVLAMAAFHQDAPPVARRPWLLALPGYYLLVPVPVLVLHSDVRVEPGASAEVRVGWRVWRAVYAEATGGLGRNTIVASIHDDIEQAPAATVSASLLQIAIEGGALVELARLPMPVGRLVVFAAGGGGYLRQVHEDRVLVETGSTIYGGGGVKWRTSAARPRGIVQRLVVRGDVRLVTRSGGVDTSETRRSYITVSGGIGLRFF